MASDINKSVFYDVTAVPKKRFNIEYWAICFAISIGIVHSVAIGFYQFRLVDIILILSSLSFLLLLFKGKVGKQIFWILFVHSSILFLRLAYEIDIYSKTILIKTLFGMTALQLTPIIFFTVRESKIKYKTIVHILSIACLISFLSQLDVLSVGESEVGGAVDLGKMFGIDSYYSQSKFSLDYQERTITIWRAMSIGVTFALLLVRVRFIIKLIGVLAFLLQYAGAGGARASLLFIFFTPIFLYYLFGKFRQTSQKWKIAIALILGISFATIYVWAPIGGALTMNKGMTHYERTMETIAFLSSGKYEDLSVGFQDRVRVLIEYWHEIISSPSMFFLGKGNSQVGNITRQYPSEMKQAHNVFFDVWFTNGLIGLIFTIVFLVYIYKDLKRMLGAAATMNTNRYTFIAFTLSTAVLYMFTALSFEAVSSDRSFMIVFYLLAGLLKPTTTLIYREYKRTKMYKRSYFVHSKV